MGRIIEKLLCLAGVLVFLTFCIRHGVVDFSWFDKIATKTTDVIKSDEGQAVVNETKDIAKDIASDMVVGLKDAAVNTKDRLVTDSSDRIKASLIKVIDGDTIDVMIDGDTIRVRFIGVDTPESVNPDESKNNIYGSAASLYTKDLLDGIDTVYLEFDKEAIDQYGRTLAYVWLTESGKNTTDAIGKFMVNGILVNEGYALAKEFKPNTKYASSLELLQEDARANKRGLWEEVDLSSL